MAEEVYAGGSEGGRVWVVGGGGVGNGGVGEEAVVEEGALEGEVDERVEGVPDEEGAEFKGGGGGEEAVGGEVGEGEEEEDGEEGEDSCLVDDGGWLLGHPTSWLVRKVEDRVAIEFVGMN